MLVIAAVIALVVAVPAVVILLAVGWPWFLGILVGLAVAAVVVVPRLRNLDRPILDALAARPAAEPGDARLLNLVEGLGLSVGVTDPAVLVLEDPAANGLAVASGDRRTLVVTTGLLSMLDRIELEGVVAELLVRLKEGDAEVATEAGSFIGGLVIDGPLKPFKSLGAGRLRSMLDTDRDIEADMLAVGVTRYPPGLTSALSKIRSAGTIRPAKARTGFDHLWLVPPSNDIVPTHSLDLRIDVLQEI